MGKPTYSGKRSSKSTNADITIVVPLSGLTCHGIFAQFTKGSWADVAGLQYALVGVDAGALDIILMFQNGWRVCCLPNTHALK
jgi:hypothetical protein